jgi:TonB family protein
VNRLPSVIFAAACLTVAATPARAQPFVGTVHLETSDYPAGTRPGRRPLSVRLRFALGPRGAVVRCHVARSSGVPAVDAASCHILRQRARFRPEPGRNAGMVRFEWANEPSAGRGNPPGGPLPLGMVERITADDYPADAIRQRHEGAADYEADVSEDGVVRACRIVGTSGSSSLDQRTCQLVRTRVIFIPASDGQHGRRAGTYNGRLIWRLP